MIALLAMRLLSPLFICVVMAVPLHAAIQETYDLGGEWKSADGYNPGYSDSGFVQLCIVDPRDPPGTARSPFSGVVQSLSVSIRDAHFWDTGSIGGISATQTHDGGPWGITGHTDTTSLCTLPIAAAYYPVSPSQISYSTTTPGFTFKPSYTGDPGYPQIPVYVLGTGGFWYVSGLYATDISPQTTHYSNMYFSVNVRWVATVVASSIVLNTTGRTLQVGYYHDFLSKTTSSGFPDSYAMGAARILPTQTNPDGSSILQFQSDNAGVCTVDAKGHVVAVGAGTCHITVTCDSAPAQIATFTVAGPPTIKRSVARISPGGSTVDLTRRIVTAGTTPTTFNISSPFGGTATWTNASHSIAWSNAGWAGVSIVPSASYHAGEFTASITDNQGQTGPSQIIFWGVNKDPLAPGAYPWLPNAVAQRLVNDAQVARWIDANPYSADPICYASGETQMYEDDLDLAGASGMMSLRRSYSNLVVVPDGPLGMSWNLDAQPYASLSPDQAYVTVQTRADLQVSFVNNGNGVYTAIRGNPATLVTVNGDLIYTDVNGRRIDFYGLAATPTVIQGKARYLFNPGAGRIDYAYDTNGVLISITRAVAPGESDVIAFTNDGAGRASLVQRIHQVGAQRTVIRQVEYQYYSGAAGDYGDDGTLRYVRVRDGGNKLLRQFYYRYYRPGDAKGCVGQLKYAIGPRNCERLFQATGQDVFAVTATDSALAAYADKYFEYDLASGRVLTQVLQTPDVDGSGSWSYAYQTRTVTAPGPNDWLMRTIETQPDLSQNVVYTNQQGQILLKARKASSTATSQWVDAYRYDSRWHMIWHYTPAAMRQSNNQYFSESYTDLLGFVATGTSPYINPTAGLIEQFIYYQADGNGGITGYPQYLMRQVGLNGTAYMEKKWTYASHTVP